MVLESPGPESCCREGPATRVLRTRPYYLEIRMALHCPAQYCSRWCSNGARSSDRSHDCADGMAEVESVEVCPVVLLLEFSVKLVVM